MSDLISLDRAKAQLPNAPSSDDALVAALITGASNVIETDCNRTFALGTYDEVHNGTGTPYLFVDNPPIQSVTAVRTNQLPAIYILYSDPTNQVQSAQVEVTTTAVVLTVINNNVTSTNTFTYSVYPTFAALATAVNNLGSPWVVTQPSQFSHWQTSDLTSASLGSFSVRNLTVALMVYWWYLPYYRVSSGRGEIFSPSGFVPGYDNYRVQYQGGYSDIPEEIQQACAELVQLTYSTIRANPLMQTETIDKYSYTRVTGSNYSQLSVASKKAIQQHKLYRVARYK